MVQDRCGLSVATAVEHVARTSLAAGPPGTVGVELEWIVNDARDPDARVEPGRVDDALPPAGLFTGRLSMEPGGQLELSSAPAASLAECRDRTAADLRLLRNSLGAAGLVLTGAGTDGHRSPLRVRDTPRYVAMESYFDRAGPDGRMMMCGTASVQVCLDAGLPGDGPAGIGHRWHLAHALGPVLVAAFANSPSYAGRRSGWKSTRQKVWSGIDPARTGPPPAPGDDPGLAWAAYALDAPVLCIRGDEPWEIPSGLRFRDWLAGAGPRPVTWDDLDYHLTTLFPPVRPHGWLELRMIDAQPGEDGWQVPAAVVTALLEDPVASERARAATAGWDPFTAAPWLRAARAGLSEPDLAMAAVTCFDAALDGLGRLSAPSDMCAAVAEFIDRYVARQRCPADDWDTSGHREPVPMP
jgi:glutamate--cysteine ligase